MVGAKKYTEGLPHQPSAADEPSLSVAERKPWPVEPIAQLARAIAYEG